MSVREGTIWWRRRDRRDGGGLSNNRVIVDHVDNRYVHWSEYGPHKRNAARAGRVLIETFRANYVQGDDE